MNLKEKEQVIKMLKATAQRRKDVECFKVAEQLGAVELGKLKANKQFQILMKQWKFAQKEHKRFTDIEDSSEKKLGKLADKYHCSFSRYGNSGISAYETYFREILDKKIDYKVDEIVLKVLSSGSTNEALQFLKELQNLKLN